MARPCGRPGPGRCPTQFLFPLTEAESLPSLVRDCRIRRAIHRWNADPPQKTPDASQSEDRRTSSAVHRGRPILAQPELCLVSHPRCDATRDPLLADRRERRPDDWMEMTAMLAQSMGASPFGLHFPRGPQLAAKKVLLPQRHYSPNVSPHPPLARVRRIYRASMRPGKRTVFRCSDIRRSS